MTVGVVAVVFSILTLVSGLLTLGLKMKWKDIVAFKFKGWEELGAVTVFFLLIAFVCCIIYFSSEKDQIQQNSQDAQIALTSAQIANKAAGEGAKSADVAAKAAENTHNALQKIQDLNGGASSTAKNLGDQSLSAVMNAIGYCIYIIQTFIILSIITQLKNTGFIEIVIWYGILSFIGFYLVKFNDGPGWKSNISLSLIIISLNCYACHSHDLSMFGDGDELEKFKAQQNIIQFGYVGIDEDTEGISGMWNMKKLSKDATDVLEVDFSNDFGRLINLRNSEGDYMPAYSLKFITVAIVIQFIVLFVIYMTKTYIIPPDDADEKEDSE